MTTQETIKKAVDYAKENNIKNIVVATTTGGNLTYLEDEKDLHIVGVTNAYDQGQNQMREEVRKHFEEAGMDIVTAGHALSRTMLFYIFWRIRTNRDCSQHTSYVLTGCESMRGSKYHGT